MNRNSTGIPLGFSWAITLVATVLIPYAGPIMGGYVGGVTGKHRHTWLWAGLGAMLAWIMLWLVELWWIGAPGVRLQEQVGSSIGLGPGWLFVPISGVLAGLLGCVGAWAGKSWQA